VSTQVPGDCKKQVCDGSGNVGAVNDDTDVPDDSNACTTDTCSMGTPMHTPVTQGTSCGTNLFCDAQGQCVGCTQPSDCGTDTDCRSFTCSPQGVCGHTDQPDGTLTSSQTSGDCKKSQCTNGVVVVVNDNNDLPVDNKQCTNDVCTAGTPSNPPLMMGTSCNQNGGKKCSALGDCVECFVASDCGTSTDCVTFTCSAAGFCSHTFANTGTLTSSQVTGDCKQNQCDGAGNVVVATAPTDVPVDTNPCTDDVCTGQTPSNPPLGAGTTCPLGVCDGNGACVGCNVASDCGTSTECLIFSCSAASTCSANNVMAGTALASQTAGDCHVNVCDGMGSTTVAVDTSDVPVDNKECTADLCSAQGVGSNPALPFNDPCPVTLGHFCDGNGACVECNTGSQCASQVCTNNACQSPTCVDNVKNGDEGGVDCGGALCPTCANGSTCNKNTDCTSGYCGSGFCSAPPVPTVVQVAPADLTSGIDPGTTIEITFSDAMDPATLTAKSTLDTGACSGTVQISADDFTTCLPMGAPVMSLGNTVATFTPAPALSYGSFYRVRVTTGAASAFGVALGSQFTQPNGFLTALHPSTVNESGSADEIDYCVVQFPTSLSLQTGATSPLVFCRAFEGGVTDTQFPSPALTVEIGYGPPTANPENQAGWTWFSAGYNQNWGNDAEYMTTFTAPAVGDYRYGCRVTMNGKTTFCDLNGAGSNAGLTFEPNRLPDLTVTP
jgi:hypothetical protein